MPHSPLENVVFVACPETSSIAHRIAELMAIQGLPSIPLQIIQYKRFASGEYSSKIPETVRNKDVLLFHAFQPDPMTSFMKFLIAANALRLASPRSIRPILPFMPFQRQDRKDEARVPITAKLAWELMDANPEIRNTITMDLHSEQEQGFSIRATDNFPGIKIIAKYICERYAGKFDELLLIGPDMGSAKRTERLRDRIAKDTGYVVPTGVIDKRRPAPNVAEVKRYLCDTSAVGKTAILIDDMIDTGGSIIAAADYLKNLGAANVVLAATHGIFSAFAGVSAEEKLAATGHQVIVTNSIPRDPDYLAKNAAWLKMLPIEETMANVIYQAFVSGGSLSRLSV